MPAIEATLRAAMGKARTTEDVLAASIVERLSVTLESGLPTPARGSELPPGWHTVFCLQAHARGALEPDGLPVNYDQIPNVPMQRRMFGGARITFHAPLFVGEAIRCESEICDVKIRSSAASHMAIVTLRHRYSGGSGLAVTEEQDIVHLEPLAGTTEKSTAAPDPMPDPTWTRTVVPDPITLFRFSALTFNSHRIHYDAPYSTDTEKLPGLMVQGKLIALQLLETLRASSPHARPQGFEYRSGRPLFVGAPFSLSIALDQTGQKARAWAADAKGRPAQNATIIFSEPIKS